MAVSSFLQLEQLIHCQWQDKVCSLDIFFFLAVAIALLVSSLAAPHAVNLAGPGHTELGKLGSLEARLTSWGP